MTAATGAPTSDRPWELDDRGTLHHYANLTRELAITQFKLKYTGSALGYLWSLLKPLTNFAVMYMVFARLLHAGADTPRFAMQLLVAIVWWGFFAETTNAALASIATNGSLIKKAYFPRIILVVAATLTALMTFVINLALIILIAGAFGQLDLRWSTIAVVPLMLEMYAFSLGMGLLLAALHVFYRDVGHLWEVFTQMLLYASAVVYPLTINRGEFARWLALNPMAQMVNDLRHFVVAREVTTTASILGIRELFPIGVVVGVLALGYWVFRRRSPDFAEYL